MTTYGGIETGGTTVACIIGNGPDDIAAETRFATTSPEETIERIVGFFSKYRREHPVAAVGIGSFGPVDLHEGSPTYGHITTTPKSGWQHVDLCGPIADALKVPLAFDTDVNAAALGEYVWGSHHEQDTAPDPLLYLTVGTGIGLGVIIGGRPLHGLMHPEAGHMPIPHDLTKDPFAGSCPFHGDCWEGLASGHALEKRWGQPGETLPADHPAWELEAQYLAYGIAALIYCFSPRRVVVGGGVVHTRGLLESVRLKTREVIGEYLGPDSSGRSVDELIVAPRLGDHAGVLGALALARAL